MTKSSDVTWLRRYLLSWTFIENRFASKAHKNQQDIFTAMIGFVTLDCLFCAIKEVAKGDKTNHSYENIL